VGAADIVTPRPRTSPGRRWLVTGAAGFIGSHLVEELLRRGEQVTALDSFATGKQANLDDVLASLPADAATRLDFIDGDIRGAKYVLHQAALGSVPRSIEDPLTTNAVNLGGTLCMLVAARDAGVARFVYASSSSVYGDSQAPLKREGEEGQPLSPYAASKHAAEIYAAAFSRAYAMSTIGLRYFNVYGPRQDPSGQYAAVIPRWTGELLDGRQPVIFGDGETSRDFTFVSDVVEANIRAAQADGLAPSGVYNVAFGARTTLNELYAEIRREVARLRPAAATVEASHAATRAGDVRHSLAHTARAAAAFGYRPAVPLADGLARTVAWFAARNGAA
jgi:UDP-N-acetylglucosamine/UDP-N-acetylgalactosamine 4-epimerase